MLVYIKTISALSIVLLLAGCFGSNSTMSSAEVVRYDAARYGKYGDKTPYHPIYLSLQNREYSKAIEQADILKQKYKKSAQPYFLIGVANFYSNSLEVAISNLSYAISLDNTRGDAFFYRALSYYYLKKHSLSLDDINKALLNRSSHQQISNFHNAIGNRNTSNCELSNMYAHRSNIYYNLKKYHLALDDINQAISIHDSPTYNLYNSRGNIYFSMAKHQLAFDDFKKSISIYPSNDVTLNMIGVIESYRDNFKNAIKSYEKAQKINPKASYIKNNLSIAYWLNGDRDRAMNLIKEVIEDNKYTSTYYYHFAYLTYLNGNREDAKKYFKKAYSLDNSILETRYNIVSTYPLAPKSKIFYSDECRVATAYIKDEKGPALENRVSINSVTIEPNPVRVNRKFDIKTDFNADFLQSKYRVYVNFYFTISLNGDKLFTSKKMKLEANNGSKTKYTTQMNPVSKKGHYTLTAYIQYKNITAKKSVKLNIQ